MLCAHQASSCGYRSCRGVGRASWCLHPAGGVQQAAAPSDSEPPHRLSPDARPHLLLHQVNVNVALAVNHAKWGQSSACLPHFYRRRVHP